MRIWLVLALIVTTTASEPLSPGDRKDIATLIERLIAAGFPDSTSMSLFSGELKVRATSGPKGEEPRLPCDASTMQETNNDGVIYSFSFPGMHAKTSTGSWLIAFTYAYDPRPTDTVSETNLTAIDPTTLTATAHSAKSFDAAVQARDWLAALQPTDRERLIQVMDRLVPVSFQLKIGPDMWPAAAILLYRAGWPDAVYSGLSIADQRARSFWQQRPWFEPDIAFDPTGEYANAKPDEQTWKDAHKTLSLEAPAIAWRRALFRICKAQINRDDPWLQPDVAAACCLVCCDPNDPQGNAARIATLRAAHDLPLTPAANANLADRLQSWEARPRQPRMSVSNGNGAGGNGAASITTSFTAPEPAYVPRVADIDALIALLDDPRPSRWIDFSGARSIGDNAWRALAMLLKQDPRALADLPVNKPWTAIERTQAAKAMQAWWKINGSKHIPSETTTIP